MHGHQLIGLFVNETHETDQGHQCFILPEAEFSHSRERFGIVGHRAFYHLLRLRRIIDIRNCDPSLFPGQILVCEEIVPEPFNCYCGQAFMSAYSP